MKKIIILIIPLLILTGCTNKEKLFKNYAEQYYNDYMKTISNIDSVTITLDDLYNASTEKEFDLTKFKKCEKSSKIIFEIEKTTKEIKNSKIELKC